MPAFSACNTGTPTVIISQHPNLCCSQGYQVFIMAD